MLALAAAVRANAADTVKPLNPNIGLVLNGFLADRENDEIPKGFSIGESELNINADIDPYLKGNFTVALKDDEAAEIEEAFIRTTSLENGLTLSIGRMLPIFGYLNEKHRHTDDFALRPLVMRDYFGSEGFFNADGVQASVVLPSALYSEIGGGAFGQNDLTAYVRIGGGNAHAWRLGASYYHRGEVEDEFGFIEPEQKFVGADFKYSYSPNGNSKETEASLYGEYVRRQEVDSGFYAAATYKWAERWRGGYMYSAILSDERTDEHVAMLEYNTSEFGRFRLQYGFGDESRAMLQYTVSMGAHAAHNF